MKRILNALTILLVCATFIYPLNTHAKLNTIKSDEDYVIPSEYTFTPKFIKGVTKFETSDTYKEMDFHVNNKYKNIWRAKDYHNYWAIYRNVGIWKQHIVDMKITVDDVVDMDPTRKCTKFGNVIADEDVIGLEFISTDIGVDMSADCREEGTIAFFKVEFFDGTTGEVLDEIKTTFTYNDIDVNERILLDNTTTNELIYYAPYGQEHLELLDEDYKSRFTYFKGNDKWTCTYNGWPGDVQCINTNNPVSNCYNNDCTGCYKAGMVITQNEGSFILGWAGMGLYFTSPSFLRIEDPNSIKTVDKEKVKPGEKINYTIEQYVPNQSNYQYYKSWELTDKLDQVLEASIDDITIITNNGEDIKDKFNVILENNVLTITAKKDYLSSVDFYNRTFLIGIPAKVSTNIKGIKKIPNTALLNVQYSSGSFSEDIPSSDVVITIEGEEEPQEVVEVPNTSKFTSMMMIISGIVLVGSGVFLILKMTKKKTST